MNTYTDEQASEFNDRIAQKINDTLKAYAIIMGANINTAIGKSSPEDSS